jgi:hypothetical protein
MGKETFGKLMAGDSCVSMRNEIPSPDHELPKGKKVISC